MSTAAPPPHLSLFFLTSHPHAFILCMFITTCKCQCALLAPLYYIVLLIFTFIKGQSMQKAVIMKIN